MDSLLRPQLILSLCDDSGVWSQPYVDDGYEVLRVDLKAGQDVRLMELPGMRRTARNRMDHRAVHGILAAPPCTMLAGSGARWTRSQGEMLEAMSVVDACCRLILALRPVWWALENPVGKLSRFLGPPRMTFQPNEFGDPYTKQTCLWGDFREPQRTPVPASEGSLMHRMGESKGRADRRSRTPEGFARAFFEANP